MAQNATSAPPSPVSSEAMAFMQELGRAVSGAPIELPSYPEVALRVQRVLADVDTNGSRIVKVISTEPVLAARVISMANSVALKRSGKQVTDLRDAVVRVGYDALRSAAIGFAVAQLRKAAAYKEIEKPMIALWQENVATAAMSFVLARRLGRMPADMAMLAGLVSGVGKLYILTRMHQYPALFADVSGFNGVMRDWHPQVARSILENWKLPEEIIAAVSGYEQAGDEGAESTPLTDVVAVAERLVSMKDDPGALTAHLAENHAARRLGLTADAAIEMLAESDTEVASLRDALGK